MRFSEAPHGVDSLCGRHMQLVRRWRRGYSDGRVLVSQASLHVGVVQANLVVVGCVVFRPGAVT